jgi:hypothetical protein
VAEFERALWLLQRADPSVRPLPQELSFEEVLAPHAAAALVTFDAPVEVVLSAVLTQAPLPEGPAVPHAVLIAPRLPRTWRPASPEEARVFIACTPGASVQALLDLPGVGPEQISSLLEAGALVRRQP